MRRTARSPLPLLAVLAMLLGSCSAGSSPGAPADTSPTPEPAETAPDPAGESDRGEPDQGEPAEAPASEATIRDVDFAELQWREAVYSEFVTPAEGHEVFDVVIADPIVYADVDGDGHEDALVALEFTDQQWFEQIYYIWTWDAAEEQAIQVESPVARMARCGDTVREVAAGEGSFAITEALRYQDGPDLDCATDGPVEVTRYVAIADGWPVLTGGLEGDGGICPQSVGTDDLWPVDDIPLHPGPFPDLGPLSQPPPAGFGEVDVWSHLWLYRENWMLVHVAFDNPVDGPPVTGGQYSPCAWVYLEQDDRPIPHDPYLPEG